MGLLRTGNNKERLFIRAFSAFVNSCRHQLYLAWPSCDAQRNSEWLHKLCSRLASIAKALKPSGIRYKMHYQRADLRADLAVLGLPLWHMPSNLGIKPSRAGWSSFAICRPAAARIWTATFVRSASSSSSSFATCESKTWPQI